MATETLTITFKGICSHFTDVVPGVRHRVVMPDASHVRMGMVRVEDAAEMGYYLLPHYVTLHTSGDPLDVDRIVKRGYVYSSVRMSVANAVPGQELNVEEWKKTPCIADYVPDFRPSNEVVMGGRASAYFDIEGGVFTAMQGPAGEGEPGAHYTKVEIKTDGAPQIAFTPFGSKEFPAKTVTACVGTELCVANADWDATAEDKPFDFLLHYLCAERGIPRTLKRETPGLYRSGHRPPPMTAARIQKALTSLGDTIVGTYPSNIPADSPSPIQVTTSSCSDTKYP